MHPDDPDFNHDDSIQDGSGEDAPSRSQLRREALDVLKLAGTLADLSDAQLAAVPISDDLRDEVRRTRAVKQQIARKRQTQFLAKQMRKLEDDELAAIRASLEHDRDHARRDTAALHKIEQWRDRLIAQGDDALNALLAEFPLADRQRLRQLARQARSEREQNKPLHAYRDLFREVRELVEGRADE